jgi:pyrroloquinoline quinone biosynthesis protein E
MNDFLSSTRTFELKRRVARLVKAHGYPMVLNVVLHRLNLDHVAQILDMAEELQADYVELANTQYYGWAYANRAALLPTREQLERAEEEVRRFRSRVGERIKVFFVVPDYHASRPKACMNGWGAVFLCVTADGVALPCHEARMLPGLEFPSVRENDLRWIWQDSRAFNRYRGDEWMREPCRTCPEKERDHGGCRCQAWLLTGDAANADPVCDKSPHHTLVTQAIEQARPNAAARPVLLYRDDKTSRALSS